MSNDLDRLQRKIKVAPSGCWEFTGARDRNGYGRAYLRGKQTGAHRVSYTLLKGEIPPGLHLDHLCRNPPCVNPDHLEAVTPRENALRGMSIPAINARKQTCIHGHSLADANNVYRQGGKRRQCRRCNATAVGRYNLRRKEHGSRDHHFDTCVSGRRNARENPQRIGGRQ